MWNLTYSLTISGSKKKLKRNLENVWRQMKTKHNISKLRGHSESSTKREVHSDK